MNIRNTQGCGIYQWSFICKILSPINTRMLCAKLCWNENNYEFRYFFCYFVIRSVCKKRHGLSWMNLNHFNPKMFVPRLIALDFNCRKSKFYKFRHCNFDISLSHWKKLWASIRTKLNSLYSRMLCATFGWNWKSGSTEEDKNVKNLQTDGQPANRKACWSFQLRWA